MRQRKLEATLRMVCARAANPAKFNRAEMMRQEYERRTIQRTRRRNLASLQATQRQSSVCHLPKCSHQLLSNGGELTARRTQSHAQSNNARSVLQGLRASRSAETQIKTRI